VLLALGYQLFMAWVYRENKDEDAGEGIQ